MCCWSTPRTDHLPHFVSSPGQLMEPRSSGVRGMRVALARSQRKVRHQPNYTYTTQSCHVFIVFLGPQQRQVHSQGSGPSAKDLLVLFCFCHLPAHLMCSHDRLNRFLTSFQLSLITLQICKSCQACNDRQGDWSSALLSSWVHP